MPFWLEAIRTEVPEEELHELKVLLWYVVCVFVQMLGTLTLFAKQNS